MLRTKEGQRPERKKNKAKMVVKSLKILKSKEEVRKQSSSGGNFQEISEPRERKLLNAAMDFFFFFNKFFFIQTL